jgi:hypothetical protein
VKGYLQNQVGDATGDLKLVVLDAEGPGERCLHAVTMQSVLEAQENRMDHLTTAYQLILDPQADAYRLQMKEDTV